MSEEGMGKCKHGTFVLSEGCPQCIAESQTLSQKTAMRTGERLAAQHTSPIDQTAGFTNIIKVRYLNGEGEPGGREYSYFSKEPLTVGAVVKAPTGHGLVKAQVTAVDVPEDDIAAFRDKVKTIPSDSIQTEKIELSPVETLPPVTQVASLFDQAPADQPFEDHTTDDAEENWKRDQTDDDLLGSAADMVMAGPDIPPALAVIQDRVGEPLTGLLQLYQEAASLLQYAKNRIISTNEDLKHTTDELSIIATCKKKMTERKREILAPFKTQVDSINQAFGDLMFPVEEADRINRDKVLEFRRIEQEKTALARREAASKAGETTVELQDKVPDHTYTGLGTQGFAKVHKWEVTDFALVPDQYKMIDAGKVSGVVKGSKGTIEIPGIRVWTEEAVRVNPRKGG